MGGGEVACCEGVRRLPPRNLSPKFRIFVHVTRILLFSILLLAHFPALSQEAIHGKVLDAVTREQLPGVHIVGYSAKRVYGSSSNLEGDFVLQQPSPLDSIRISCIGYTTTVLRRDQIRDELLVLIRPFVTSLQALTVKPASPEQLIRDAVRALPRNYEAQPFQIRGFYREQIHKSRVYFSVAEAVFESQVFPGKGVDGVKLKLVQGRRSETVQSTRIFEDFHPGGGPNYLMGHILESEAPEFLQEANFSDYEYSIDSITAYDGNDVYVISFDQTASLKENLWAGTLYLDAESLAFIDITFALSTRGRDYRQHLTGTDKMMAGLLGIDYEVLDRKTHYSYRRTGTTWSLHEASLTMDIHFIQPRKSIDEQFTIQAEMLALSQTAEGIKPFSKNETWQKNQLVKNLPGEFDEGFWGSDNYIQPETTLSAAIEAMDILKAPTLPTGIPDGWMLLHAAEVKAYQRDSTLMLKPYVESRWKDEQQGPFLWKRQSGDFEMFTRLRVTQAKDTTLVPDAGFQAGGLMVRADGEGPENYILFGLGCMGNPQLKLISQNTIKGNSAIHVTRVERNDIAVRLRREGNRITLHYYVPEKKQWVMLREIRRDDLPASLQAGIAGFAYFPGNGPNRQPDILVHAKGFRETPIAK